MKRGASVSTMILTSLKESMRARKSRKTNSWIWACYSVHPTLAQCLPPQEAFSADKFSAFWAARGRGMRFRSWPRRSASIQNTGSTRPSCGSVAALLRPLRSLGGEADVINTSGPALINARLTGTPVLYVTNFNDWSDAHLLVRPEVTSMEQLRSGKFAVPGLGGGYAHMLRTFIFPKYGLDKGAKQPTILSAGDTPSALPGS